MQRIIYQAHTSELSWHRQKTRNATRLRHEKNILNYHGQDKYKMWIKIKILGTSLSINNKHSIFPKINLISIFQTGLLSITFNWQYMGPSTFLCNLKAFHVFYLHQYLCSWTTWDPFVCESWPLTWYFLLYVHTICMESAASELPACANTGLYISVLAPKTNGRDS